MKNRLPSILDNNTRASQRLYQVIRERILEGQWGSGDYLPSIRELCVLHKSSIDTVSRALRNLADDGFVVSEPRRGFRILPRIHSPQAGCPLALIVPGSGRETLNPIEMQMSGLYQEAAMARGLALLLIGCADKTPEQVIAQLSASKVWGIILNAAHPELLQGLLHHGMPVVAADAVFQSHCVDEVNQDGFRGGLLAGDFLGSHAHEKFCWMGMPLVQGNVQSLERYAGAVAGLAKHGKALTPEFTYEVPSGSFEDTLKCARHILSRTDRPTGFFALWQNIQKALVVAARELGLRIGQDFEVVGWSTEEQYESNYVPLFPLSSPAPAVTWSLRSLVKTAMARLEERRNHPDLPTVDLRISTHLQSSPSFGPAGQEMTQPGKGIDAHA